MNIDNILYEKCFFGENNKTLFLTITNYGYLHITLNLLKNLSNFGLDKRILIFCFDRKSYETLKELKFQCYLFTDKYLDLYSKGDNFFGHICYYKLDIFYKLLELNYNFIYTDSDIIFLQNPINNFLEWEHDENDIFILNDSKDNKSEYPGTGFLYVKNNNRTIKSLNHYNRTSINMFENKKYNNYDSSYFNMFVKYECKIVYLPQNKYTNYSYYLDNVNKLNNIILLHFNNNNNKNKKEVIKKHNFWLLDNEKNINSQKIIINYYIEYDKYDLSYVYGIGDYIRGCISLYYFCKNNNYKFEINYFNHSISNYLTNENNISNIKTGEIKNFNLWETNKINNIKILKNYIDKKNKLVEISTNLWHIDTITEDCLNFLKSSFKPNELLENKINEVMDILNIKNKNYICLHARLGDNKLINMEDLSNKYKKIEEKIKKMINVSSEKIIIFSDDTDFKKYMSKDKFCSYYDNKTCHLGMKNNNLEDVMNTLVDLFILGRSKKIYQYSEYSHGSGFSYWIAKMNNINIEKI